MSAPERVQAADMCCASAGEGMQKLKQLPGLLKRLDRGLRGVHDALALRLKMQAALLQDHLAERLS